MLNYVFEAFKNQKLSNLADAFTLMVVVVRFTLSLYANYELCWTFCQFLVCIACRIFLDPVFRGKKITSMFTLKSEDWKCGAIIIIIIFCFSFVKFLVCKKNCSRVGFSSGVILSYGRQLSNALDGRVTGCMGKLSRENGTWYHLQGGLIGWNSKSETQVCLGQNKKEKPETNLCYTNRKENYITSVHNHLLNF